MALWPFGSKEKAVLTPEQRTALTSIVKKSKFEIIPLKGSRKNRMRRRPVQRSPWLHRRRKASRPPSNSQSG